LPKEKREGGRPPGDREKKAPEQRPETWANFPDEGEKRKGPGENAGPNRLPRRFKFRQKDWRGVYEKR